MQPNPVLKRLGFSESDRLAIIHTDDIGMCQASVGAFADLQEFGLISSGAIMVPCPWFLEAAAYARAHPAADLGVHLTTTSEWQTYRWGPISTRDPQSGLIDEEGYFYHHTAEAQDHGKPAAVKKEIEAQVARAIAAGIQPTHIDTHMGTVAHAKFFQEYIQLAIANKLPLLMFRLDAAGWRQQIKLDPITAVAAAQLVHQLEEKGMPLLDHMSGLQLDADPTECLAQAKMAFTALEPGITHFIIHPSQDTPELRAIAPDWRGRVANYETFLKPELRDHIHNIGIHVIGYRDLKNLIV